MNNEEFEDFLFNHDKIEYVSNGIYDVTDIEFLVGDKNNRDEIIKWLKDKNKFWIADDEFLKYYILYKAKPKKYYGKSYSSGYLDTGTISMFINCPNSILIIENN